MLGDREAKLKLEHYVLYYISTMASTTLQNSLRVLRIQPIFTVLGKWEQREVGGADG